jgi:tetratricopeptide (TPR) repeat protein
MALRHALLHDHGRARPGPGDLDAARRLADQSLEIAVSTRSRKYESRARRLTGAAATARRRWDDADAALREALAIAEAIGEPRQTWKSLAALGRLHRGRGQPDGAYRHYRAARDLVDQIPSSLSDASLRRGLETSPDIEEILARGAAR